MSGSSDIILITVTQQCVMPGQFNSPAKQAVLKAGRL